MFFFDYWTVFSTLIQFIHELAPRSLWFSVCNKPPYGALRLPLTDSVEREHQPPLIFAQYFKNVRATIKMIWMVSSVSSQTMPQSNITVICSKFGECPQRLFCLFFDYKSWHISSCGAKWKRWGGEGLKIKSEIPIFLRICLARHFFRYIISMCDEIIITLSASYFENILNCYKSELLFNFLKIRVA